MQGFDSGLRCSIESFRYLLLFQFLVCFHFRLLPCETFAICQTFGLFYFLIAGCVLADGGLWGRYNKIRMLAVFRSEHTGLFGYLYL